jgi:hypothetical protein
MAVHTNHSFLALFDFPRRGFGNLHLQFKTSAYPLRILVFYYGDSWSSWDLVLFVGPSAHMTHNHWAQHVEWLLIKLLSYGVDLRDR